MTEVDSALRITLIGGGGGGSVMAAGLAEVVDAVETDVEVTALTSIADSGGSTGRLRDMFGAPGIGGAAVGDLCRLVSATAGGEVGTLLRERFGPEHGAEDLAGKHAELLGATALDGQDIGRAEAITREVDRIASRLPDQRLVGHTYGNLILASLYATHGERITPAIEEANNWFGTSARILPMTNMPHHVRLFDGHHFVHGEAAIDEHAIVDPERAVVWLTPSPEITPEAYDAIARADIVLVGPGSPFTSLLPALTVRGVREAMVLQSVQPGTRRVAVANLVQESATPGLRLDTFIRKLVAAMGVPFTDIIHNDNLDGLPEGEVPIRYDETVMDIPHARIIGADLVGDRPHADANDAVAASGLRTKIHHSPEAVARVLQLV